MQIEDDVLPALNGALIPPMVRGIAFLTTFAYMGHEDYVSFVKDNARFGARNTATDRKIATAFDTAIALFITRTQDEARSLQDAALATSLIYRVGDTEPDDETLRVLAIVCPGDLMANTPIDFLTNNLNIRLDLLYVLPGTPLPDVIPDHDVAFFAASIADPAMLARLRRLYALWPRPVINDPRYLPALERDELSRSLAGIPGLCSPTAVAVTRTDLESGRPIPGFEAGMFPCLIRPAGSHAGMGLSRMRTPEGLAEYLAASDDTHFVITAFEDYSSPDGLFRKSRVTFVDRQPFLAHMAVSSDWMVHYLNAGMEDSEDKRAEEAQAMADFDSGFAQRHAAAFAALHERLGFDYYAIDCAETKDGRLLVFEADAAAIVHMLDDPDMFPYKLPPMRALFAAFDAMLRERAQRNTVPALTHVAA